MDFFYSPEQRLLRDTVRRFARERIAPAAAAIDRDDVFPREIYQGLAEMGLFGVALPESAGGAGLDTATACIVMEEIACGAGAVGNMYALPVESVLMLNAHGNQVHKDWIPRLLAGSAIPATAVTEAEAGSDVAGMRTTARTEGDHYVINGAKAWVTFGGVCDFVLVFAKTSPEHGNHNISCYLVECDRPGVRRGVNEQLMGMHGLEDCEMSFDNVRVPAANRLGPENQAFRMAMSNFNVGRLLMASMALGMTLAAFEDAQRFARERRQFGQAIGSFQAVQFMLADMSTDIDASRLLIHHAARLHEAGQPIARQAAQAKLFTTDMAMKHVSNALQIHGGAGYSRHYRVERIFRDVKLAQIYEGTNQIQRLIIARQIEKEAV